MTIDFTEQRVKMVDGQVRTTDVTDLDVLAAFLEVPREEFVPTDRRDFAYADEDIRVGHGEGYDRYLMQASPLARLLQLAELDAGDAVLDVGCATGYSSALLSRLAAKVTAIEADSSLAEQARANLSRLGYSNVTVVDADLAQGHPGAAPYDVIVVGGAVDKVPDSLFSQLKEGGRLVAVEGHGNAGVAKLFLKSGADVSPRGAFNAALKPLPGFESQPGFHF